MGGFTEALFSTAFPKHTGQRKVSSRRRNPSSTVIFCQSKVRLPPEPCHRLTCTSTIRAIVSPLEFHFFFFGGGGGGAFGGTYPSVVRLRFGPGPGPGFDGSFGTRGLTCYVVAVVVALWVARIPLFEDSLTVPVVAAELVA